MTTDDISLHIFYLVATTLPEVQRHSQAKSYPSELVTIGILFALKGGHSRAFYRWLQRDYGDWFGDGTLPERTVLDFNVCSHLPWRAVPGKPIKIGVTCSCPIQPSFPLANAQGL